MIAERAEPQAALLCAKREDATPKSTGNYPHNRIIMMSFFSDPVSYDASRRAITPTKRKQILTMHGYQHKTNFRIQDTRRSPASRAKSISKYCKYFPLRLACKTNQRIVCQVPFQIGLVLGDISPTQGKH